jgi:hypothetical protein
VCVLMQLPHLTQRFTPPRSVSSVRKKLMRRLNGNKTTLEQVKAHNLPTRDHKHKSPADKKWPHVLHPGGKPFACELDAMEPDMLRDLVEKRILRHLPQQELEILKVAEKSERDVLRSFVVRQARIQRQERAQERAADEEEVEA